MSVTLVIDIWLHICDICTKRIGDIQNVAYNEFDAQSHLHFVHDKKTMVY